MTFFGSDRDDRIEDLRLYIDRHCIHRVAPGEHPLPGRTEGTTYRWQFYLRRALFVARYAETIALMFLDHMREHGFDFQVAGPETAGPPIVSAIVMTAHRYGIEINGFAIRKERKRYGLINACEGVIDNRAVVLVDDIFNSGASLMKAFNVVVGECYMPVRCAWVIVNIGGEPKEYMPRTCPVTAPFTLADFNLP